MLKLGQLDVLVFHDLLKGFNQLLIIAKVLSQVFILLERFFAELGLKKAILLRLMKVQEILRKGGVLAIRTAHEPPSVIVDSKIRKKVLRGCVGLESFSDFPFFIGVVSAHKNLGLQNTRAILLVPSVQLL
jgi:hypothetical protein